MTVLVTIVCEAAADKRTASRLADRVLLERVDWLGAFADDLDQVRSWRGRPTVADEEFLRWISLDTLAREAREVGSLRRGEFRGLPTSGDSLSATRALTLLAQGKLKPDLVVLIRDADDRPARADEIRAARDAGSWPFLVVVGVPVAKREAWVLAGFDPASPGEESALAEERRALGFDPRVEPETLDAKLETANRSAKRVSGRLAPGEREEACLETSLEVLRRRGLGCGLTDYLAEVAEHGAPVFGGQKGPR